MNKVITKEERENLTMLKADIEELVSGGTSEQTAKIVAGRNYIEYLLDTIDEMEKEIERLKDSIERHRRDVWGDGVIEHDSDVTLYEVLK